MRGGLWRALVVAGTGASLAALALALFSMRYANHTPATLQQAPGFATVDGAMRRTIDRQVPGWRVDCLGVGTDPIVAVGKARIDLLAWRHRL